MQTTPSLTIRCASCRGQFPVAEVFGAGTALVAGLLGTCPACAKTIELTPEAVTFEAPRGPASVVDPPDFVG